MSKIVDSIMNKQKTDGMLISFTILGLVILLFIAWPLVNTILSAEPEVLWQTVQDWEVQYAIRLTFQSSLIATLIAFICGVPLAYILARYDFPGKWLVEGIIDVPHRRAAYGGGYRFAAGVWA